jgi:CBS domain-containing protein
VFCFELSAAHFLELVELSLVFKDFCTRRIAVLFEQSNRVMQAQNHKPMRQELMDLYHKYFGKRIAL